MNIAIVGCGLIGQKRLNAIRKGDRLVMAADVSPTRAQAFIGKSLSAVATSDWREAVSNPAVDTVIVSTTNDWLAPVTLGAVQAGKHVLVEKPGAIAASELDPIIAAAKKQNVTVWVGFNHRFHPAMMKAREIFESGAMGPLMFIRARYGHGGRVGYDTEWRANPKVSGGGELIDQGTHLIDLSRWFLGDFSHASGFAHTYFWNMQVDDNAFLFLRTETNQTAWLHASCTEWKNLFSFEIYGRDAKLHIEGLGGSYGIERLSYYQMLPQMGPPDTVIWEYPGRDSSWESEFEAFCKTIEGSEQSMNKLRDAQAALRIVEAVYRESAR